MNRWIGPGIRHADEGKSQSVPNTPLDELDKDRAPAPAPVPSAPSKPSSARPPAQPIQPPPPMPLEDILKLFESAGKAIIDGGLRLSRAIADLEKVSTMTGITDKEREIVLRAQNLSQKIGVIRKEITGLADDVSKFRESIVADTGAKRTPVAGWLNRK